MRKPWLSEPAIPPGAAGGGHRADAGRRAHRSEEPRLQHAPSGGVGAPRCGADMTEFRGGFCPKYAFGHQFNRSRVIGGRYPRGTMTSVTSVGPLESIYRGALMSIFPADGRLRCRRERSCIGRPGKRRDPMLSGKSTSTLFRGASGSQQLEPSSPSVA